MDKITLSNIEGGYNLSILNDNFNKIATIINNRVLFRDVLAGESNTIESDLDINGKTLYNVPAPTELTQVARLQDVLSGGGGEGANSANLISFSPSGNISSTTVQGAIEELDTEKAKIGANTDITSIQGTTIPVSKTLVVTTDIGTSVQAYDVDTAKLDVAQTFSAVQTMNPTSASSASYTWAVNTNPNLVLTTTANLTLNAPTGLTIGAFYFLEIVYGGTHTITWDAAFKGVTGLTITSTAAARDAFMFRAQTTSILELVGTRLNVGA